MTNKTEVHQILKTFIEQSFAKLVASITNALTGSTTDQLNLCTALFYTLKPVIITANNPVFSLSTFIDKFISDLLGE